MGLEQLEAFKAGLRKTETDDWLISSMHRGPWKDGDGEVGTYGVRVSNFAYWAAEIGLGGADWQDPDVMERVVTAKLVEYYNEYGDWDLVAMAWIGGTELADVVGAQPDARSANKYLGRTVGNMADEITQNMNSAPVEVTGVPASPEGMPYEPGVTKSRKLAPKGSDAKMQLVTMFESWGNDLAGGQRVDYRELGSEVEAAEQVMEEPIGEADGATERE